MASDDSALKQLETSTSPLLVVIGAGPKAAALAAKARAMHEHKGDEVRVVVIERNQVGAHWMGGFGYTDGQNELCTPPEKDVGYPFNSSYGSDVNREMLRYTWQAYLIDKTAYPGWLDRGRRQPPLSEWAKYIEWVLEFANPQEIIREMTVTSIEPSGAKLIVHAQHRRVHRTFEADGVVLTGPGEPIRIPDSPPTTGDRLFDGKNYWTHVQLFADKERQRRGKVAVIGGGGTAASIALSLLRVAPHLEIDIINRHGTIFTRGESFREKSLFCDTEKWQELDEFKRQEFIKRTDRGVFSVGAQKEFDQAENIDFISGEVVGIEDLGNRILVRLKRGKPSEELEYEYDRVIVALGFDPFSTLKLIPEGFRPKCKTPEEQLDIQRKVDNYLRLPFDTVPELAETQPNIHVPMLAGLAQGVGFQNLACLSVLSDRILSRYVPFPTPSRFRETKK
jgi:mycobactin lysine-N-oxygenase